MSDRRETQYEIFISYSRRDNQPVGDFLGDTGDTAKGWVTALYEHILADHRRFSTEPLRIFFDQQAISDMDDWRHRILTGLRSSKILLVCLSPNYFASENCLWEWDEYCRRQVHQLMGSDSVATVYFVEAPGSDEHDNARRLDELLRGNFTDIRPWFPNGVRALQEAEVQRRMSALGNSLWERLQRARRAEAVPGNLRWQNPHFVGRREELRKLHEQLGTGVVGVVKAVLGLGGQGKTELAVAYAHAWADCYPAGLWSLAAEGHKELLPLIGTLAWERALGFTPSEAEKNDPALLGRGVLEHLKARAAAVRDSDPDKGAAALLLLDNVSEPELLSPAQLATLPGGLGASWLRIVATTRLDLREQKNRLAVLEVHSLDEETALSLIRDHQPPRAVSGKALAAGGSTISADSPSRFNSPAASALPLTGYDQWTPQFANDAEEAAAREIVRSLGGFTLAVEQVALYLGLHPEVTPSAFLTTLQQRGLPLADTLPDRDPDVAAQMLTQSKQLGLILDATLVKLDLPMITALQFAALLPPDSVPWPWLRALTVARHPELGEADDLGADPWLAVQRRLSGLRLLTSGDQPEIARIHRLVAAHVGHVSNVSKSGAAKHVGNVLHDELIAFLRQRAEQIYRSQASPQTWELDALLVALPALMEAALPPHTVSKVANDALFLSEKVMTYRNLSAAESLVRSCHVVMRRLAESDRANAAWQRDLSVSFNKLGRLAIKMGRYRDARKLLCDSYELMNRLADLEPLVAARQEDLADSLSTLGQCAIEVEDLAFAKKCFSNCFDIREALVEHDPEDAEWKHDLAQAICWRGYVSELSGDRDAARNDYRRYHSMLVELWNSKGWQIKWNRDLSVSFHRQAQIEIAARHLERAEQLLTESLYLSQCLAEEDETNAHWQHDLSASQYTLAKVYIDQGRLSEALELLKQSYSIDERLVELDPDNATWASCFLASKRLLEELSGADVST